MANSVEKKPAHQVIIEQLEEFNQCGIHATVNPLARGGIIMLTTVLCRIVIPAEELESVISSLRKMTEIFDLEAMSKFESVIRANG